MRQTETDTIKCILLATTLMLSSLMFAQSGGVSGVVIHDDKPVEFATIFVKEQSKGTSSNQKGEFNISSLSFGTHTIIVRLLGFQDYSKSILITASNPYLKIKIELLESNSTLNEVVVSGTMKEMSRLDSPVPVEVYSAEFFKANPTPSLFESMQNINGVRPQLNCNVCNTGDIHINGLEGPYTMVLIDGMPIVSGLSTVYGLTGIPQSLIERVEIVKGPASTLYGSEAVGGLINIITKKPSNAPLVSADVFSTSWGEVNSDLGIKFKAGKKANSLLGLNYFNYQNPIDNNGDNFTDVTLQNRVSLFNKWSFDRKENRLFTIAGRYVYEDRWGGEMNFENKLRGGDSIYGESIFTSRWELFGTYQLPFKENINLQISANGHDQNSTYGTTIYNANQTIGFGQLVWNKSLGVRHDLLLGSSIRYTFYDDDTFATTDGPNEILLPGIFLQDELIINETNKILLGLRYDHNSKHGSILSPRLNYKWSTVDKKNTLRVSIGNGYRVANVFTEDHAALTGAREIVFKSELKPETSWNANINYVKNIYTKKSTFIGLDATLFYTYFDNRIIPDYISNPNLIIYDNLDGFAISKGVSLNVDITFMKGLKLLAGGTFMDVSVEENGTRETQILTEKISGVWSVGYRFTKLRMSVDYTGNLYGPMRLPLLGELDDRAEFSPWWSLQNIQITKEIKKKWEIYGGVKNILNYTPPANSIARAFDPFDNNVVFDANGQVVATTNNPNALTFDPSTVFAPNQGIRGFFGIRYTLSK